MESSQLRATTQGLIGHARYTLGEYQEALHAFRRRASAPHLDPVGLAAARTDVGRTLEQLAQHHDALATHQLSTSSLAESIAATPTPQPSQQHQLALSRIELARVTQHLNPGHDGPALAIFQSAVDALRHLTETDPHNPELQHDLVYALNEYGDCARAVHGHTYGLEIQHEAQTLAETLVSRDPLNARWNRVLTTCLNRIGDIHRNLGAPADALPFHTRALELRQQLAQHDPGRRNAVLQTDLIASHFNVANTLKETGAPASAVHHLESGLAILHHLQSADLLTKAQKGWFHIYKSALKKAEDH